eukprot:5264458-Pyramimonas_sp.AAC.1
MEMPQDQLPQNAGTYGTTNIRMVGVFTYRVRFSMSYLGTCNRRMLTCYVWTRLDKDIDLYKATTLVLRRYRHVCERLAPSVLQHLPYKFSPYASVRIGEAAHPGPPGLDRALQLLGLGPTNGNRAAEDGDRVPFTSPAPRLRPRQLGDVPPTTVSSGPPPHLPN